MAHSAQSIEGAQKPCPQCLSTLVFNGRYPILTVGMVLVPDPPSSRDRIRYVPAWLCQNGDCDYRETVDDV